VSAPKLMVINNQTATLQVGDEVPIVTRQAQSVVDPNAPLVTTVELRDTGVILEVKPRINSSHMVVLEVSQEVSDVTQTTTSGIDSPTIQQRRFSSTVAVQAGETVALGGLIRNTHSETETSVPLLGSLPVLGAAFRTRDITERRTELIVFLTPHIIGDVNAARETLDILRSQMRHLQVTNPVEAQAARPPERSRKNPLRLRPGL
ncbi:MAG: type II and III secretion system protein, partial [Pseudomonadota bacterium]